MFFYLIVNGEKLFDYELPGRLLTGRFGLSNIFFFLKFSLETIKKKLLKNISEATH